MKPTVTTGEGEGEQFIAIAEEKLSESVGFTPYHGTLNLRTAGTPVPLTEFVPWEAGDHCDGISVGNCYAGGVAAAVVEPDVPSYPREKTELVAPVSLRTFYGLEDGDELPIGTAPNPDGLLTELDGLSGFPGVVLDVDRTVFESVIEDDELEDSTARISDLLGTIAGSGRPVGVLSDLEESTVTQAISRLGADDADIVTGSNSKASNSDRSDCLVDCIETLGCSPREVLLVSDRPECEQTAKQAGTSVVRASNVRSCHGTN